MMLPSPLGVVGFRSVASAAGSWYRRSYYSTDLSSWCFYHFYCSSIHSFPEIHPKTLDMQTCEDIRAQTGVPNTASKPEPDQTRGGRLVKGSFRSSSSQKVTAEVQSGHDFSLQHPTSLMSLQQINNNRDDEDTKGNEIVMLQAADTVKY
ncbi:hypothetical protein XENORESO_016842 [Xenotaenia resolanae]|uniref:Uncharacterized protein n=1 Tax=Xenotaenia resolanae TaxID=208358 RepID=A0ABV0W601_9TELE